MLQPQNSTFPNHQHCKTEAGDELQVPEHYKCPVRDVHQCAPSACQSCSRCLCLFGWQHELCSVLKSPSFSRASSVHIQPRGTGFTKHEAEGMPDGQQDANDWLSNFYIIVKSMRSNSRSQALKIMKLAQPWNLFLKPFVPFSLLPVHVQKRFSRFLLQPPARIWLFNSVCT